MPDFGWHRHRQNRRKGVDAAFMLFERTAVGDAGTVKRRAEAQEALQSPVAPARVGFYGVDAAFML